MSPVLGSGGSVLHKGCVPPVLLPETLAEVALSDPLPAPAGCSQGGAAQLPSKPPAQPPRVHRPHFSAARRRPRVVHYFPPPQH